MLEPCRETGNVSVGVLSSNGYSFEVSYIRVGWWSIVVGLESTVEESLKFPGLHLVGKEAKDD